MKIWFQVCIDLTQISMKISDKIMKTNTFDPQIEPKSKREALKRGWTGKDANGFPTAITSSHRNPRLCNGSSSQPDSKSQPFYADTNISVITAITAFLLIRGLIGGHKRIQLSFIWFEFCATVVSVQYKPFTSTEFSSK